MLSAIWNHQVRILPVVLGLLIFGMLHLARRFSRVAYTPSYFAVFPLSILDHQLSLYFGEFYGGEYLSVQKGRRPKPDLFVKSLVSLFLTFFLVPVLLGALISSFLLPQEFPAFLLLLLFWEGSNCLRAILDFTSFRGKKNSTWLFFGSFYATYLLSLFFSIRLAYKYAQPFFAKGNFSGLIGSVEDMIVPFMINAVVVGVLGGVLTHWFLNKDAIAPSEMDRVEASKIPTIKSNLENK